MLAKRAGYCRRFALGFDLLAKCAGAVDRVGNALFLLLGFGERGHDSVPRALLGKGDAELVTRCFCSSSISFVFGLRRLWPERPRDAFSASSRCCGDFAFAHADNFVHASPRASAVGSRRAQGSDRVARFLETLPGARLFVGQAVDFFVSTLLLESARSGPLAVRATASSVSAFSISLSSVSICRRINL